MPPEANNSSAVQQHSADGGNLPHETAHSGTVPQPTAEFGNPRQPAASHAPFRNMPSSAVKTEHHILTVKEVARMFEAAGVSRIERTIVNWCHPNQFGVAKLDAFFDTNERRHLITPQSVERAIKEEQSRVQNARTKEQGEARYDAEMEKKFTSRTAPESDAVEELRFKLRESEISSKLKDQYIANLETRYDQQHKELLSYSRSLGQLEERLLQLDVPKAKYIESRRIPVVSETKDSESETVRELS